MTESMTVFDRTAVRRHRDRAALGLDGFDFLFAEVAERLMDRLDDISRAFPVGLDLGCHGGEVAAGLQGRGGIQTLIQGDLSEGMARRARATNPQCPTVTLDEEGLPFGPHTFDIVLSNLSLHWVNDLPGAFVQINRALKPDGLFLATLLGGVTLHELRHSLTQAEMAVEGGASPRVSPFADVRDVGNLLQRAGFAMPVVDAELITASYSDPLRLMADLRGMGETNAVTERRKGLTHRRTMMEAAQRYRDEFADADGRIPATFQVIYVTAWAPDANQPKPARAGSGQVSLADVLGTDGLGTDTNDSSE